MSADNLKIDANMRANKEYSPIDMIKSNIKTFQDRAKAHRADAERSMRQADKDEVRLIEWQLALEKLNV